MANRFESLSDEELIAIMDAGDFDEKEFPELVKAMERKGLRGMITSLSAGDAAALTAVHEYMEYHKKIGIAAAKLSDKDVRGLHRVVRSRTSPLEKKKRAIVMLANQGTVSAYEVLKQLADAPPEPLIVWVNLAVQECKAFLSSELLENNVVTVGSLAGTVGTRHRFYAVVISKDKSPLSDEKCRVLDDMFHDAFEESDAIIERIQFGSNFALLELLIPFDVAPAEPLEAAIESCRSFLATRYIMTNTHKPTETEIRDYFEHPHTDHLSCATSQQQG